MFSCGPAPGRAPRLYRRPALSEIHHKRVSSEELLTLPGRNWKTGPDEIVRFFARA